MRAREQWDAYDEEDWETIEASQKSELLAQNDMFWKIKKDISRKRE